MKVHFWGVCGSVPAPLTTKQIKSKISAVVERISASDLETQDAKEKFLASLPPELFGTVGGNTACIQISTSDEENTYIIFDAGSGIREFSISEEQTKNLHKKNIYHIFFSHFHWDHIQGLPFFTQAYNSKNEIHFYSTKTLFQSYLKKQMENPFFPVSIYGQRGFKAKTFYHVLEKGEVVSIGNSKIYNRDVNHPGGCTSYKIVNDNRKIIYSTDTELLWEDFLSTNENKDFYEFADVLIIDAQYTMKEALEKASWGHSAFSVAADFAANWKIKNLVLFHHEPLYTDQQLYKNLQTARWYMQYTSQIDCNIQLATEGWEFEI